MKIIVNGQEVIPCKKNKLLDQLSNSEIQELLKDKRRQIIKR